MVNKKIKLFYLIGLLVTTNQLFCASRSKWDDSQAKLKTYLADAQSFKKARNNKEAAKSLTKALEVLDDLRSNASEFLKTVREPQKWLNTVGIEMPVIGAGVSGITETKLKEVLLTKIEALDQEINDLETAKSEEKTEEKKEVSETGKPAGVAEAEARRHDELRALKQHINSLALKKPVLYRFYKDDLNQFLDLITAEYALGKQTSQKLINIYQKAINKIVSALEMGSLRNAEIDDFIEKSKREAGIMPKK